MDNLKSLFTGGSSRDGKGSLGFIPDPPTVREMIDDIERCGEMDPVRVFAKLLRDSARQAQTSPDEESDHESDEGGSKEDSSTKKHVKLQFPPLTDDNNGNGHVGPNPGPTSPHHLPKNTSPEQLQAANQTYDKLKKLSTLMENSQIAVEEIKPLIKALEGESKSFMELLSTSKMNMARNQSIEESFVDAEEDLLT